jgi:hypothetical protein
VPLGVESRAPPPPSYRCRFVADTTPRGLSAKQGPDNLGLGRARSVRMKDDTGPRGYYGAYVFFTAI